MRYPAGQDTLSDHVELATGVAAQPLLHRVSERSDSDPIEQRVAHPVGLHHPVIERVGNPGGSGDEFQVWPGTVELPRERGQPSIHDTGGTVCQQLLAIRWAAVTELVRREGIADEQQCAGQPITHSVRRTMS